MQKNQLESDATTNKSESPEPVNAPPEGRRTGVNQNQWVEN